MRRKILIVSYVLALPAVARAAEVRVDYDRHKKFSKYRTFSVVPGRVPMGTGAARTMARC